MSVRPGRALLLAAAAAMSASCGILLGVDDLEPVDCVGACEDERDGAVASPGDGGRETSNAADAPVDITSCDAGAVTLAVSVKGLAGSIDVDPPGRRVRTGESLVVCLPVGTGVRFQASSSAVDFAGVDCEAGEDPDRCDFTLQGPTTATVTFR